MGIKKGGFVGGAVAIAVSFVTYSSAEKPSFDTIAGSLEDLAGGQVMLELPVRVVDTEGGPVAKARVTPWALRSSQGHGWWRVGDERADVGPHDVFTNEDGIAVVRYPRHRDVQERIRTLSVSLWVDHPEFAYVDDLHINVPLETNGPHEIELVPGVPIEIRPLVDSEPTVLDDLFALWSDGRSWQKGAAPEQAADGAFRIPAMPPGENSFLLVKLDGDRATHFSEVVDLRLDAGVRKRVDVPLRPALSIEGVLSDNVPRPVRRGRIKMWTLAPAGADGDRVTWFTWVPIRPDGTFTIAAWPAEEALQLIALCDGYIAASGIAPAAAENPREPEKDPFNRPQVFDPVRGEQIKVAMTPLIPCAAAAVDEDGKPVSGVTIASWPNVGWWNGGSQVYCHPLVRCERLLRERDYNTAMDETFPQPFQGETGADGKLTLELPAGAARLAVTSDTYELPAFLGKRDVQITLTRGETTEVILRLQARGTEKLGEWDKLAGVVFGCSTREGRRICALPGVREQMNDFAKRYREAKNQRDPQLLAEAYSAVADAFIGVGDAIEAAKWRQKAAEQTAKVEGAEPATAN